MGELEDRRAYERVEAWVEKKLGLHFDADQKPAVRRRLEGLARRLGHSHAAALVERLEEDEGTMANALAETVATHHTGFFREPAVLERITADILPSLPRSRERRRVWSAAASTGEELYSVAMLLAEHLGPDRAQARFALLGTDLVPKVVRIAERAEYGAAAMKSVSPERRARWFEPVGGGRFRVGPDLKAMCTLRRLNLVTPRWPFEHGFSLILCRNVLYYFGKPARRSIVQRLFEVCEPGGWLLTSVSESLHELRSPWTTVSSGVHRKPR
jgi:chemotaxis protein methyltransferase CheR